MRSPVALPLGQGPLTSCDIDLDPLTSALWPPRPLDSQTFDLWLLAEGQCVKNRGEELAPSSLVSPFKFTLPCEEVAPAPISLKKKLLAEGQCVKNPGEELGPSSLVSPIKFSQSLQV